MKELTTWLDKKEISYKIFAIDLDVDQTTLYKILRGQAKPSMKLAKRIEDKTDGSVRMQVWVMDQE